MAEVRERFRRLYAFPERDYVLPGSLDDLDGPTTGVLTMPDHLDQLDEHQRLVPMDLSDPRCTDAAYRVLLARCCDDLDGVTPGEVALPNLPTAERL